jgi:hypothetical protein
VHWDLPRSPTSVVLLTGLGADHGVPAQTCLRGSGLTAQRLLDPDTEVTARQEQTVIRNLLAAVDDPDGLGLEAGSRYHLTTFGIWGFALISSRRLAASSTSGSATWI